MEDTRKSTYTPAVGDHVMMPRAPENWNPHRVYTVSAVTDDDAIQLANGSDTWSIPIEWSRNWGITRTYSRKAARKAINRAGYLAYISEDGGDAADDMITNALSRLASIKPVAWVTYDAVSSALNDAANEASEAMDYENSDTIRDDSARDLAVNAALYLLDHPDADLYDVIVTQYKDVEPCFDNLDEDQPDPPRGSKAWNDALVKTVTEWVS
jgi:hypothetical protein